MSLRSSFAAGIQKSETGAEYNSPPSNFSPELFRGSHHKHKGYCSTNVDAEGEETPHKGKVKAGSGSPRTSGCRIRRVPIRSDTLSWKSEESPQPQISLSALRNCLYPSSSVSAVCFPITSLSPQDKHSVYSEKQRKRIPVLVLPKAFTDSQASQRLQARVTAVLDRCWLTAGMAPEHRIEDTRSGPSADRW